MYAGKAHTTAAPCGRAVRPRPCTLRWCNLRAARHRRRKRDPAFSTKAPRRARRLPAPARPPTPAHSDRRQAAARPQASRTTCGSIGPRAAPCTPGLRRSYDAHLEFELFNELRGGFLRIALEQLCLFRFLRQVDPLDLNGILAGAAQLRRREPFDLLRFRFLDAH